MKKSNSSMSTFVDHIRNENLIENLIKTYDKNFNDENEKKILNRICNKINEDGFFRTPIPKVDLFGQIYEKNVNHEERKVLGEFYTPLPVVDYILDAVGYSTELNTIDKKIIDLSCGSGSFIIQVIRALIKGFICSLNRRAISDLAVQEARGLILRVKENVIGVDINPIACILCQLNIHLALFEVYKRVHEDDNQFRLPIFKIYCENALTLIKRDNSFLKGMSFDYVIGNPPYLFIRDIPETFKEFIEKNDFKTNMGQYDFYQIFVELGIRLLKNQGCLGYIVPDSLLALSNRRVLRKYIFDNTRIREIYHVGPKFDSAVVSNIIIILQKESNIRERESNEIKISLPISKIQSDNIIIQKELLNWDYKFLVHLDGVDIMILNHLSKNFTRIRELMKKKDFDIVLQRGIELGKGGKVFFCKNCNKFMPLPKTALTCKACKTVFSENSIECIILKKRPNSLKSDYKPFLYSINRYMLKEYRYINVLKEGINYKNMDDYNNRIIIRQLSQDNLICAALDTGFSLTSQSFYNLKIRKAPLKQFNNHYLLALINSQLLSYFFIKSFSSYKMIFPRILIEKIKNLPIKIPKTDKERELASELIKEVERILDKNQVEKTLFGKSQRKIDDLVYELYQVSKKHREHISSFMKTIRK